MTISISADGASGPTPRAVDPAPILPGGGGVPHPGSKKCRVCGETKPLDLYYRNKNCKDGHNSSCKVCMNARSKKYREQHKAEIRAYQADWLTRNPGKRAEYAKASRQRHPDRHAAYRADYRQRNPEAIAARARAWKQANKDKVRGYTLARKARLRGAPGRHSHADWQSLCRRWQNACAYCGDAASALTRDHIIPLTRGGSDFIGNILPACFSCNASKGNKTITEWRGRGGRGPARRLSQAA